MRHFKRFASFVLTLAFMVGLAQADIVDSLDFSTDGDGAIHKQGTFPLPSSPVAGGIAPDDWELTYDPLFLLQDNTLNTFQTEGGVMRVLDWGGAGTITSSAWIATSDGVMDIVGEGVAVGVDVFDDTEEGVTWFYSINGSLVSTYLDETALGGSPVSGGTDVGFSYNGVAVSSGDSVVFGFTVNVEGEGDGANISGMTIDFTAAPVPEPSSLFLLGFGFVGLLSRRRRV